MSSTRQYRVPQTKPNPKGFQRSRYERQNLVTSDSSVPHNSCTFSEIFDPLMKQIYQTFTITLCDFSGGSDKFHIKSHKDRSLESRVSKVCNPKEKMCPRRSHYSSLYNRQHQKNVGKLNLTSVETGDLCRWDYLLTASFVGHLIIRSTTSLTWAQSPTKGQRTHHGLLHKLEQERDLNRSEAQCAIPGGEHKHSLCRLR